MHQLPVTIYPGNYSSGQVMQDMSYTSGEGRSYRYYTGKPLFSFGDGLSYTTFELSDLALAPTVVLPDETFEVAVTIENTGARAGTEVVQLYLHDRHASVTRPVSQLAGFASVDLEPGERRRLRFDVAVAQLALLDRQYRLVIEPGAVDVMVGTSSRDIALRGHIVVDGETVGLEARGPFYAEATVEEL